MKRVAITLTAVVAVLLALPLLVYVPPVQRWLVGKATEVASEATGMDISIKALSLRFPLTLSLEGVKVMGTAAQPGEAGGAAPKPADTIAFVGRVDADMALLPLIGLKARLDGLTISDAHVNTLGLISDTQVCGDVGQIAIGPTLADLTTGTVDVSSLLLSDASLSVLLSDTAAIDTTESNPLPWHIALRQATLSNVSCEVHLPGDSVIAAATLARAAATGADIDLLHQCYAIASVSIAQSALSYDSPHSPPLEQGAGGALMDYAHLSITGLSLEADSFVCQPPSLTLAIRQAALKEHCGLQLNGLKANVELDSLGFRLPSFALSTPFSSLYGKLSLDYAALDAQQAVNSPSADGELTIDASLSRHDLAHFCSLGTLPEWPLSIQAKATGNIRRADIETLVIDYPTVLHAEAQGDVGMEDSTAVAADVAFSLVAHNAGTLLKALTGSEAPLAIPSGLSLEGTVKAAGQQYDADVTLRDGQGTVKAKAMLDAKADAYAADVAIAGIDLRRFLPAADATIHQAAITAKGHGYDLFDKTSYIEAAVAIDSMTYAQRQTDSVRIDAVLDNAHLQASVESHNSFADGTAGIGMDFIETLTSIKTHDSSIKAQVALDLALLDLRALGISDRRLDAALTGDVDVATNLKDTHRLSGLLKDIALTAVVPETTAEDSIVTRTFHPENLGVLINLRPDTTYARVQNGNFIVKLDASGPYDRLLAKLSDLADTIARQADNGTIDQAAVKEMLPEMRLYITSGRENAPANILRAAQGIDFKELLADITTSPDKGMNGSMYVHRLGLGSTIIDTVSVTLKDSDHGLTYQARIANGKKNPLVYTALMDGQIYEHGARLGLRIFDKNGRQGLRMGTQIAMETDGIRFTLLPKNPTLAFSEFALNDDNYIFLRKDMRMSAKVEMENEEGTTIDVYSTEDSDTTRLQDITVSLAKIDLKRIAGILPFIPKMEGTFNGDFHVIMDKERTISVATDADVEKMVYEGNDMGDIDTEFVYLQNTDNTHTVDGILLRNGKQVASVEGQYINKKGKDGQESLDILLSLVNTPLDMANGFITDKIVGLEGYANGMLTMKGPLDRLIIDGSVNLDSAILFSTPYGIRMAIDNQPITIEQSKLTLSNFKLYASPEQRDKDVISTTFNFVNKAIGVGPQEADTVAYITINGSADFGTDGPAPLNFRIRANELLLVNAKQQMGSLLYGKGFVSIMAMVRGTTEKTTVRGRIDVLGKTDITYLLLDSPLSTDNQMDELVHFTDFSDSTVTERLALPAPSNINMNLTVNIDQGAHIRCGLNAEQSNYVDIFGGGELRLRMSESEDMTLTGRYTITSGVMKYSLPVIPLKTFTIQDGSYVEFTGAMDNPTLNITATERTKATVGQEGTASRSVTFDCGVEVTKTLKDMGVSFTISAPEDITVQSELQAMTVEQRGKLAVTMLTTGMYLADGNTAGFSMNSALSSFLQSEINNIAGNALSTLDISMGVDNTTDASGNMHTDYSFQFAKRFWNNRLKVEIGGKVSSGQEAQQGQRQSFFDNVSMEYRLSPNSNQYLKLFYKQNVYDWLDGYTGEYGAGYIYKRKMEHWWNMFQLWKKSSNTRQ